jgi:hypothetical protein
MKVLENLKINTVRKDKVPKLGAKESAQYVLLTGGMQPDPAQAKDTPWIYPTSQRIPLEDDIMVDGEHHKIMVVETYNKDSANPKKFIVAGLANNGMFSLHGSQPSEVEIYEFLELCNANASNPNRNPAVTPIFRRIDKVKDAKQATASIDALTEALVFTKSMTEEDMRQFAASMGWNENVDMGILESQVKTFAKSEPEKFLRLIMDEGVRVQAILKKAIDKELITWDAAQYKFHWANGNIIATLDRVAGKSNLQLMAEWVLTSTNGTAILESIERLLDPKKSIKTTPNKKDKEF